MAKMAKTMAAQPKRLIVAMTGATLSAAQKALAGRPGEMKTIVVERAGAQVTAQAKVSRIL